MSKPIRAIVVDDSPFICRLMMSHLQSSVDIEVVSSAQNGARALDLVREHRPDVVTLDVEMPGINGLETLRRIMEECPTPVVMVSGVSQKAADITLDAVREGAVDFILKYTPGVDTDPEALRREVVEKVKAAASVKVIRSLNGKRQDRASNTPQESRTKPAVRAQSYGLRVVVIGASTGGPTALRELLCKLPAGYPEAIIIVQHMPATFTNVLAAQLDRQIALTVREAADGDVVRAGEVLIAPGDRHLILKSDYRVQLSDGPKIGGHRPSVDVTMQSVAHVVGADTKGVLLTGMGNDGADGLATIFGKGGDTFAQDADSCVIYGMPRQAIERGVVQHIGTPEQLGSLLTTAARQVPAVVN